MMFVYSLRNAQFNSCTYYDSDDDDEDDEGDSSDGIGLEAGLAFGLGAVGYGTTEYLEMFLRNLLLDEKNELHNR